MNAKAKQVIQSYSASDSLGALSWAIEEMQNERARELAREAMQLEIAEMADD